MAIGFMLERATRTKVRKTRHATGVFVAVLMACPPALATDVTVVGLTAGKAIVVVDGGKPRTLTVGQTGPGGVKLIGATSESAVLEIDGKRRTLGMGQAISGSFQPADKPSVSLTADTTGHYVTAGSINGAPVRFLVDTGATLVSIGASDARRLGLRYLAGEKGYSHTANGVTTVYRIKLDSLKVGTIAMTNVDAVVHPDNDMPFVLLGMSFLGRLELRHEGRTLTMTRRF